MKSIRDLLSMFADWSEDELQTGLMLICKKFGLHVESSVNQRQMDFGPDVISSELEMRLVRGNSLSSVCCVLVDDTWRCHWSEHHFGAIASIHQAEKFSIRHTSEPVNTREAMQSLLAIVCGETLYDYNTAICSIPSFSSLSELMLKLEIS